MPTFVVLLRAVNVGSNQLSSKDFMEILESLKLNHIKTYIQTGNAIFQTTAKNAKVLPEKLKAAIKESHSFAPEVVMLTLAELETAVAANPFPEAEQNPKSLHLTFLAAKPKNLDLEALEKVKLKSEAFKLLEKIFYFYAPDGVGRSKAAAKIEKCLGVSGTTRNWRTVNKLLEMARAKEE